MTVALVLVLAATAAVLCYGLLAWERIVRRRQEQLPGSPPAVAASTHAGRPEETPDRALSFGPGRAWVVVRASSGDAVVRALGLRTVVAANWRSGLDLVRGHGVFVTPAVDGWVLAVGADLRGDGNEESFVVPLLQRLSATFGHAAWFATHAAAERHGWALSRRGELQRGYAFDGEQGHVFWRGEVTDAERELGCFVDDPRDRSDDEVKWWPDERIVMSMAAAWSLDPRQLGERARGVSSGWFGRL